MTHEIMILMAVLLLLFVLTGIQVSLTMKNYGNIAALKGRDDIPGLQPGLAGRLNRAIDNLKESLHFFVPLILLTAILGISNDNTILGAQIYLLGRVLHAPFYLSGIAGLRTAAFVVGVVGLVKIATGLFAG